jgi:hypothetical protein
MSLLTTGGCFLVVSCSSYFLSCWTTKDETVGDIWKSFLATGPSGLSERCCEQCLRLSPPIASMECPRLRKVGAALTEGMRWFLRA